MSVLPERHLLPDTPPFPRFYRAINGRDPFPWQSRLADQVANTEAWPEEVGVPTGLGKTACLDIAVWWLASQADRDPAARTAPTRIWWLVNRRLLVDATTDHAEAISRVLSHPEGRGLSATDATVVTAVADRLRSLAVDRDAGPLEVIRLRGGVAARSPSDPSSPAVMLSTLPMYGSRLLFRGYGSTRSMRPIDAAMAGTDSLVIVDEAHLARHLISLVPTAAECAPHGLPILGPVRSRPTVVALTATGDATEGRFDLDADDEAHPVVRQRLDAAKPTSLRVESGAVGQRLAEAARDLIKEANSPASCLMFTNTPATARDAFRRLGRMIGDEHAEILLLTGRAREREAERTRQRILDPREGLPSTRDPSEPRQRHLIVVATQTLEVGADVDAEYLVTETCGVRALTQRLGRLNRLGHYPHARAIYIHVPPDTTNRRARSKQTEEWPVYQAEPATVLQRLQLAARSNPDATVALGPRRIAQILGPPGDDPGRAPETLKGLLWEWIKTTSPPAGEAPVEPYFSGITAQQYSVSLIWRVHVPASGELLWPRATDRETVEVPLLEAREALQEDAKLRRLGPDGVTIDITTPGELRPGDVIVLASDRGLLDQYGWEPQASSPVADLSIAEHGLPLNADALRRLCGVSVGDTVNRALGEFEDDEDPDEAERDEAIRQVITAVSEALPFGWERDEWDAVTSRLQPRVVAARKEVARLPVPSTREPRSDELDEMSLSLPDSAVELDLHGAAVAARARSIADLIGVAPELALTVERAGRLHDIGKADARFQRWLDPNGLQPAPVAKSQMRRSRWTAARVAAGWPARGRHEALSARLMRRWLQTDADSRDGLLADLLVHLVVSHHGSGRPLVPPVTDQTDAQVHAQIDGTAVSAPADLSIIDWSQPARFAALNDWFGPWGLALLEAIVRRADHAVSAGARVAELELS